LTSSNHDASHNAFFQPPTYFRTTRAHTNPQQVQTFLQDEIKSTQHFISVDMQNLSK